MRTTLFTLASLLLIAASPRAGEAPVSLFDGKTLAGWRAPDMSYFSVEDGAITGTVTAQHLPPRNQFIVWQGGLPANFELTFKVRMSGAKANSGMQFRSEVHEQGLVHGYQADVGAGKIWGGIWDEYGTRSSLAGRGEKVVIDEAGKRTITRFATLQQLLPAFDLAKWNEYRITASGAHMVLRVNGVVTADLEDHEKGKAHLAGVLSVPVVPEPMKVQYKDITLTTLK